ncbi:hypothetical protein [Paractinoplanes brasiliensis]|uniref:Uncharacterized protein n=1 Tax=Paractinoplanes brasiliensis TaxID=52695 RepID=A0A4R6J725_9ACTN|nr:hypothetical protein [Actinoplanes brasiliensis]MDY7084648.1 hypothetical protein [Actinomycetota bacterium]TDO31299.1 hypothetical protein C8E87_6713 [Actinoplanes brasiliensis]GID28381.1 hypothetical protein Abr02nite_33640 [Actinoplanes brasiliensis]
MTQPSNAGASTEQHITGSPETEKFPTDNPPDSNTPAGGSSNKGINDNRANLNEGEPLPEPPD